MLGNLELFLRQKRRLVGDGRLILVLLREERVPRIARESMVEIAIVPDEG